VEAPIPVEAASANVTPRVNGGRANEVEPQPKDASDGAALILGSLRGPASARPVGPLQTMWGLLLGPLILWTWELVSWSCQAALERHSCPPAGGK
jgi:hypothetical protein